MAHVTRQQGSKNNARPYEIQRLWTGKQIEVEYYISTSRVARVAVNREGKAMQDVPKSRDGRFHFNVKVLPSHHQQLDHQPPTLPVLSNMSTDHLTHNFGSCVPGKRRPSEKAVTMLDTGHPKKK